MTEAMCLLKPNTFKLWCYMAKNQNNHTFALSCVDVCEFCSFTKKTYLGCVQELIDVGYLVLSKPGSNAYDFYEKLPQQQSIEITIHKEE